MDETANEEEGAFAFSKEGHMNLCSAKVLLSIRLDFRNAWNLRVMLSLYFLV